MVLWLSTASKVLFAKEIFYPQNAPPRSEKVHPFAGETKYPEGEPIITHEGKKFRYYNDGSGLIDINLTLLPKHRGVTSPPVVSPNFDHVVYTGVYSYPYANNVSSKAFYMPARQDSPSGEGFVKVYTPRVDQLNNYEILSVGNFNTDKNLFRSLTVVDWSYDSNKVLLKEKVGVMDQGIIKSNIWVYTLDQDNSYRIDAIRKAIISYWLREKKLDLNRKTWDIEIKGWEKGSNEIIIVNAYIYKSRVEKEFLGCWSINTTSQIARLISLDDQAYPVGKYGLIPIKY